MRHPYPYGFPATWNFSSKLSSIRRTSYYFNPHFNRFLSTRTETQLSLIQELQHRGLVESITGTDGELDRLVQSQRLVVYAGIDPTASSLHIGHLLPLMNLLHFYLNGHHSIGVIGKATACIGDPSGRSTERNPILSERVKNSFDSLWSQVGRFFEYGEAYAVSRGYKRDRMGKKELLTNSDWLESMSLIQFLGTVGRNVRVSQMLARDSVKSRMASTQGINFAEFTYQLLQSYDFWHLYNSKSCRLQIGGNDQYGNITAGIDLISRLGKQMGQLSCSEHNAAYGLTVPLLTTASGEKLGKSAGNGVWLDENLTSPFELYQYFMRLPDDVVEKHLKMLTLISEDLVERTMHTHVKFPGTRTAQSILAKEAVTMIHGEARALNAEIQSSLLFPPSRKVPLSVQEMKATFSGKENLVKIPKSDVLGELVSKVLPKIGAVKTRNEAFNLIKSGGVYVGVNAIRVDDLSQRIEEEWFLESEILLVRIGKGKFTIVCLY